jgi:broad specificity phosphatase PhoE
MELILVRHGRIEGLAMRPRDESALGPLGEQQARRAGMHLSTDPPFALEVCSPLLRARQTADIIGASIQLKPVVIPELTEMTDREMTRVLLGEVVDRLLLGRGRVARQAGEFLRAPLIGRVGQALAALIAEHTDSRVLMVAHGGVIWGVLTHLLPEQRRQFSRNRQVANCSITRVSILSNGARLISLNETAHLGDLVTY